MNAMVGIYSSTSVTSTPALVLAPAQPSSRLLRLVRAVDGLRLCGEEGCQLIPAYQAGQFVDEIPKRDLGCVRDFLSRVLGGRIPMARLDNGRLLMLLRDLIKTGELVVVRAGGLAGGAQQSSSAEQRRLVRAIDARTRGRLTLAGRHYRLVADSDLRGIPDRDSYEVEGKRAAEQVLTELARQASAQSTDLGQLLAQAREKLTADWRPPLEPDGLILLRKNVALRSASVSSEPPLSPSQMKKLLSDWIEIEVVDEDGVPYTGSYTLELPGASSVHSTFDEHGFYGNHAIDSGNCKLLLPGKEETTDFAVTLVDELGKPLAGVELVFTSGDSRFPVTSDGSGVAKRKIPGAGSVQASFASADSLAKIMKPIWASPRKTERRDWVAADDHTTTVTLFGGQVVTVVPDESAAGSGLPKVTLEAFAGLAVAAGSPVKLSVQPVVITVRLLGQHFDTDKCFLLPQALHNVQDLVRLHAQYDETDLLIVGHADTSGDDGHNLDLSLERSAAMQAYLTDDAEAWLAWYGEGKPSSKRWSATEDCLMIGAVVDGSPFAATVAGYQEWHNALAPRLDGYEALDEDGAIGPLTRKQLILDYMHREDTTVPDGITIEVHGCGEFFPLEATGETLDTDADDDQHEQEDRRVEVFLFPKAIGIAPPVPGDKASQGEEEYPEWRRRSVDQDLTPPERPARCVVSVILLSNSANVVLANRPYQLRIDNGPTLEGATDAEGFLEHTGIPAGDHTLVVDGFESRVGATPPSCQRRPHMVAGYVLVEEDI
jgi:outer membrane protein OmpA-like peptidoglycan-associated protein